MSMQAEITYEFDSINEGVFQLFRVTRLYNQVLQKELTATFSSKLEKELFKEYLDKLTKKGRYEPHSCRSNCKSPRC